jgi:hypothetical protein
LKYPINFSKGKTMAEASIKNPAPEKAATKPAKAGVVDSKVKKTVTKKVAPVAKSGESGKSAVAKKAPVLRKSTESKAAGGKRGIGSEQRYRMIAEAAYFRAESNQFQNDPVRNWIEAERDIATLLGEND